MKPVKQRAQGLNRREALELLGSFGAGVGLIAGCGTISSTGVADGGTGGATGAVDGGPLSCVITPMAVEGPFFVDEKLNRSDLTNGETDPATLSGYPLGLTMSFFGVTGSTCAPLPSAFVDVWQANVTGLYSDEPSNFVQATNTQGQKYLRGYQMSGTDGVVRFKTIYPGWYATRTIHIHVKVRLFSASGDKALEANTQLYFDDATNDRVLALPVYATRGPRSIPKNTNDQVFNGTGPGSGIDTVGLPAGKTPPGAATVLSLSPFNAMTGSTTNINIGIALG